MKLIEFKRALQGAKDSGKEVVAKVFKKDSAGNWLLYYDPGPRKVSIVQSNRYAFATMKDGKICNSWADFPKATEIRSEGNMVIVEKTGWNNRIEYEF